MKKLMYAFFSIMVALFISVCTLGAAASAKVEPPTLATGYTVSGVWYFNEEIDVSTEFEQKINFIYGGVPCTGIKMMDQGHETFFAYHEWDIYWDVKMEYADEYFDPLMGESWSWTTTYGRTVDFGGKYQDVTEFFYNWLYANATQTVPASNLVYFDSFNQTKNSANNYTISITNAYSTYNPMPSTAYCISATRKGNTVAIGSCEWQSSSSTIFEITEDTVVFGFVRDAEDQITFAGIINLTYVDTPAEPKYTLSGGWKFNETIIISEEIFTAGSLSQEIRFTSDDFELTGIKVWTAGRNQIFIEYVGTSTYDSYGVLELLTGPYAGGGEDYSWNIDMMILDFGNQEQEVSEQFYNWFILNTSPYRIESYYISGNWKLNDTLTITDSLLNHIIFEQNINFTSNSTNYSLIRFEVQYYNDSYLYYNSTNTANGWMYSTGAVNWLNDAYKVINFGSAEQKVSKTFYDWFTANANQVQEDTYTLSGIWRFRDEVYLDSDALSIVESITFTSNGNQYYGIDLFIMGGAAMGNLRAIDISYITSSNDLESIFYTHYENNTIVVLEFIDSEFMKLDFGSTPQVVSEEFYNWFTTVATDVLTDNDNFEISGTWKFVEDPTLPSTQIYQLINYTDRDGNNSFDKMIINNYGVLFAEHEYSFLYHYVLSWEFTSFMTVNFGTEPQTVSLEFYDWFTANATKVIPDTTAPTFSSYTSSYVALNQYKLSITNAADETALHETPYCFISSNSTSQPSSSSCSWQSSNILNISYNSDINYHAFIKDAANNITYAGVRSFTYTEVATISGEWTFVLAPTLVSGSTLGETVNYTSNGATYNGFMVSSSALGFGIPFAKTYYKTSTGWTDEAYRTVNFGTEPLTVTKEFYDWFTANATEVIPDTTAPTFSSYTSSYIALNQYKLSITNAADETALHETPYCFISSNSTSQPSSSSCSWQSSNILNISYNSDINYHAFIKDAANNITYAGVRSFTYTEVATISGEWTFVLAPTLVSGSTLGETVNYTSNGATYNGFMVSSSALGFGIPFAKTYYKTSTGWTDEAYRTVNFGTEPLTVTKEFYNWFTANANEVIPDTTAPTFNNYYSITFNESKSQGTYQLIIEGANDETKLHDLAYCFVPGYNTSPSVDSCDSFTTSGVYGWKSENTINLSIIEPRYMLAFIRDAAGNITFAGYIGMGENIMAPAVEPIANSQYISFTSFSGGSSSAQAQATLTIEGAKDSTYGLHTKAYCFLEVSNTTDYPDARNCLWQSSNSIDITEDKDTNYAAFVRNTSGSGLFLGYQKVIVEAPKYTLSGTWVFNEVLVADNNMALEQTINFTTNNQSGTSIRVDYSVTTLPSGRVNKLMELGYYIPEDKISNIYPGTCVYSSSLQGYDSYWNSTIYKTVNFGSTPQGVSEEFYVWFIANATEYVEPTFELSGTWMFNNTLTAPNSEIRESLSYAVDGRSITYTGIRIAIYSDIITGRVALLNYMRADGSNSPSNWDYNTSSWMNGTPEIVRIDESQQVSKTFYDWFIANATEYVEPTFELSGKWQFNSTLTVPSETMIGDANFYINTPNNVYIKFSILRVSDTRVSLYYMSSSTVAVATNWNGTSWSGGTPDVVVFDGTQTVSKEFYNWFVANAVEVEFISGIWQFNNSLPRLEKVEEILQNVNFTSNGKNYTAIRIQNVLAEGVVPILDLRYSVDGTNFNDCAYATDYWDWGTPELQIISFGSEPQLVTKSFYDWLIANATTYVDKAAPTFTSYTLTTNSTTYTLEINGVKDNVALHETAYCFVQSTNGSTVGSDVCKWQATATLSFPAPLSGTYYGAYIRDAAGNITYAGMKYAAPADTTGPTVQAVNGGSSNWQTGTTLVVVGANDAGIGLHSSAYCFLRVNNANATNKHDECSWQSANSLVINTTVNTYYKVFVRDANQNVTSAGIVQVKVDTDMPTVTVGTSISSTYVDLLNGRLYVPATLSDATSGADTIVATNSLSFENGKLWFSIDSVVNGTLAFTFTGSDIAGNIVTGTRSIAVQLNLDTGLKDALETALNEDSLVNNPLTSINEGKQVRFELSEEATRVINNLATLGVQVRSASFEVKYIFVTEELSNDLSIYKDIAKTTTIEMLESGIASPLGQKGFVYLVVFFNDFGVHVASGSINATVATVLSTEFDTYASTETTYQGAGLGEDGTVVSFSSDATSSMAVTLGASNMIEKRDVYGNLEWEKAITSSGKIELKKVINNEYGILVLGETTSGSINGTSYPLKGGKDILVIRLNKDGDILFTNVIGTVANDLVISGDMNDNRIAIISSINENYSSLITMNVDGTGLNINNIASTNLTLTGVAINANKVVVIGTTTSETITTNGKETIIGHVGEKDAFVLLYTDNNLAWARRLGGVGDDTFYSVSLDNNNIYIVGQTGSALVYDNLGSTKILDVYGAKDGMIAKYDYNGNMIQLSSIGGVGDDFFNQIYVTSDKVIVAGTTTSDEISASHYQNNNFRINKLGETDALIITLNKSLIIEEGLNLSYEEGMELQEIGINQYTEQLMILSSAGVHTQKVIENTLKFNLVYENGVLKVKANEEIASAVAYDGTNYYEIGNGIKLPYGAYEIKVTSKSGQVVTQVIGLEPVVQVVVKENTSLATTILFASILALSTLTIIIIRKHKKALKRA